MLSIDPGDGPRPVPPEDQPVPGGAAPDGLDRHADIPALSPRDIVPPQAMANGGTILRPGAVAWGGTREGGYDRSPYGGRYSSCEAIERALAAVVADPARLPDLLAELAAARLWVPLPDRGRPFTDGTAVRLPLVGNQGTDFVPCFTSVQRLSAWAPPPGDQRAGDPRTAPQTGMPHVVVPAAGLARRLPPGIGLALNPDSAPGLPLYPECVPYLARLAEPETGARGDRDDDIAMEPLLPGTVDRMLIGHPPAEPAALLTEARTALRALPTVLAASLAWLSVPGQGAGLVIAVGLDDPASDAARTAAVGAIERAAATVALRVPVPLDVTFTGEPAPGARDAAARNREARGRESQGREARGRESPDPETSGPEAIDAWIAGHTRPFYVRA
jgi:hypothetical protein